MSNQVALANRPMSNVEKLAVEEENRKWDKLNDRSHFESEAQRVLLSFDTSTAGVLEFVKKTSELSSSSPFHQNTIQFLIAERAQRVAMMSNALRALYDGIASVVRNIRA